eukprot:TRINITY_DN7916_c0_g1_i2.p1 TRINITY_DN7916_c0_g1~~TRINITY_DN7916_c0_g1_i2.p1  ORF type:complete len:189 (-),score=34.16 TRINITY_DN7916_c0_g1_i2:25-591(-)
MTLLRDSNLEFITDILKNRKDNIVSKATCSKRTKITNLKKFIPEITHTSLVDTISNQYIKENLGFDASIQEYSDQLMLSIPKVKDNYEKFQTWDWLYGKTPQFEVVTSGFIKHDNQQAELSLNITIKHGTIMGIDIVCNQIPTINIIAQKLIGFKYSKSEFETLVYTVDNSPEWNIFCDWLLENVNLV